MTRQLLFVQGGGANTHDAWDSRLVESLGRELGPGYEIRYPRMPNEDDPQFAPWKAALRRALGELDDGALLVAHSVGATILVHSLAEEPPERSPAGLFLIAMPFIGEGGWPSDEIAPKPDLGARLPPGSPNYGFDRAKGEALLDVVIAYRTPLAGGGKPVAFLLKQLDLDCSKRQVRDEANYAFGADQRPVSMSETPTAWAPFPAASTPIGALLAAACTGTLPTSGIRFHGTEEALMRDMARRLNGGG
ncbi:hypothetical protein QO010_001194 [Caulobacter ginsengisoli]|uniref:AB hydrolase-1 domain-containing protein n=1 Tax=Caulobacter ginsengisoli TaxID=400775 RepID=A0ABU0IQH5_9CAUL|nr:alpha/beta fold hydrolase [Caulobacter ginsengisoli]MDQ0463423.1 hypothetical protein [Caulobacter ginsengisoli]